MGACFGVGSPVPPPEGGEERIEVECVECGKRMWVRRRGIKERRLQSWVCVGGHVVPGGVIVREVGDVCVQKE